MRGHLARLPSAPSNRHSERKRGVIRTHGYIAPGPLAISETMKCPRPSLSIPLPVDAPPRRNGIKSLSMSVRGIGLPPSLTLTSSCAPNRMYLGKRLIRGHSIGEAGERSGIEIFFDLSRHGAANFLSGQCEFDLPSHFNVSMRYEIATVIRGTGVSCFFVLKQTDVPKLRLVAHERLPLSNHSRVHGAITPLINGCSARPSRAGVARSHNAGMSLHTCERKVGNAFRRCRFDLSRRVPRTKQIGSEHHGKSRWLARAARQGRSAEP